MTKIRHPEKINNPVNPIKKKPNSIKTKIFDSTGAKLQFNLG